MSKNKSCGDYIHSALVSAISDKRFQDACKLILYGLEARNKKGKIVNLFKTTERGKNIFHLLAEKKMLSVSLLDMLYNHRGHIWKRENRDPKNADDDLVNLLIAANNSSDTPIKTIISKSENPLELIERFNEGRHYIKFIISTNVECLTHAASATGKAKGWSVVLKDEKGYISQFVERLQVQNLEFEKFGDKKVQFIGDKKVQFILYLGSQLVNVLIDNDILDNDKYSQAINSIEAEKEKASKIETDEAYSKIEPHKDESLVPTSNQEVVASTDVVDTQVNTHDNTDGKTEKKQNEQQQLTKDSGKIDIDSVDNQKFLKTVLPIIYKKLAKLNDIPSNTSKDTYITEILERIKLEEPTNKIDITDIRYVKYVLHLAIYLGYKEYTKDASISVLHNYLLQIANVRLWDYKDINQLKAKFFEALVEQASFDDLSFMFKKSVPLNYAIRVDNDVCANSIITQLKELGKFDDYQLLGHYQSQYVFKYGSVKTLKCFLDKHSDILPEDLISGFLRYQKNILAKSVNDLKKSTEYLEVLCQFPSVILSMDINMLKKLCMLFNTVNKIETSDKYQSFKAGLLKIFASVAVYKDHNELKQWVQSQDESADFSEDIDLSAFNEEKHNLSVISSQAIRDLINNPIEYSESTIIGTMYTNYTGTEENASSKAMDGSDDEAALAGVIV